MKDGRFENVDELRAWLSRRPGVWTDDEALRALLPKQWPHFGAPTTKPDCPKCHGAGHYVVEANPNGWRMVDCPCADKDAPFDEQLLVRDACPRNPDGVHRKWSGGVCLCGKPVAP